MTLEQAWAFFSNPNNLNEITPPELAFKITSPFVEAMHEGQIVTYRVKIAPCIYVNWVTEIKAVSPNSAFVDEQRFGPYAFWHHRHSFEITSNGIIMQDLVSYALPFGIIGRIVHALYVKRKLRWIFQQRMLILNQKFGTLQ